MAQSFPSVMPMIYSATSSNHRAFKHLASIEAVITRDMLTCLNNLCLSPQFYVAFCNTALKHRLQAADIQYECVQHH